MSKKIDVLLILEGTYPFVGGGVSTWAHLLCSKVQNAVFTVYTINAQFQITPHYDISYLKKIIQVPIWSALEPQELALNQKDYHVQVAKKMQTNKDAIKNSFVPLLTDLLRNLYDSQSRVEEFDAILFSMWKFFQLQDYKKTMQDFSVWQAFKYHIEEHISGADQTVSLHDITVALRWLYRFLMPLSIDVPKADLAHLTIAGFPVIPALVLKYKYNTPLLLTEHGVFIRERLLAISQTDYSFFLKKFLIKLSERITQLVYYKADQVISVNAFNSYWEKMYGADTSKINIVYNGIDFNLFQPAKSHSNNRSNPTVVAAARIFELKDIITMIRSCAIVKKSIPSIRYLVYGDKQAVPAYTAKCELLIKELNLADNFILAGVHRQPHLLFLEGDLSILTSISEGFPYTVIESMSCGIPVVATDVGGVCEALDESCGFLCKPKDHQEIAEKVILLLQNSSLREQMGLSARKKVIAQFGLNQFISRYEAIYEKLAKQLAVNRQPVLLQIDKASITT